MQKGYYSVPDLDDTLCELMYPSDNEICGMAFLHGVCGIFALALHDVFNYDIGWILDDEEDDIYDPWHHLVHVFCHYETEEGTTVFVDIRGSQSDEDIFETPFEDFFVEPQYDFNLSCDDIKDNICMDISKKLFDNYYAAAIHFIRTNNEAYTR